MYKKVIGKIRKIIGVFYLTGEGIIKTSRGRGVRRFKNREDNLGALQKSAAP